MRVRSEGDTSMQVLSNIGFPSRSVLVRRGIRTLAHRSGLRPERSALDHSAILTLAQVEES